MTRYSMALTVLGFCLGLAFALPGRAQGDLAELDLEKLLETTVTGASKHGQKQSEVAAAVSVITREEIKAFGWRTLAEALESLRKDYSHATQEIRALVAEGQS